MLRDRDRSFTPKVRGAILSRCLARAPAWAFCPMTSTLRSEPWPRIGRPPKHDLSSWNVTDDWPDRCPITDAEVDVFEAWFGDLFDELFGPCR